MAFFPVLLLLAAVLPPSLMGDTSENKVLAAVSTALSTSRKEIQEEIVNKHNELRRAVSPRSSNMLKMKWNRAAAVITQNWAINCKYHHSNKEFERIDISCSENLSWSSHPRTWSQVIQSWYNESRNFTYSVGPRKPKAKVGHYTQVVWNIPSNVGCGFAICPGSLSKFFYVCHYCPVGNILGRLYRPYTKGKPVLDVLLTVTRGFAPEYEQTLHPALKSMMAFFPVLLLLAAVLPPSLLEDVSENEALVALSTSRKEIQEEIVNKHNELRRAVSPSASDMLKMKWNSAAAENAQMWAYQCNYIHSNAQLRRINMSCGENLFMSSNPITWSQIIQGWYDEKNDFIYNAGPKIPGAVVGHYTQVVWDTSFNVGCGFAICPVSPLKYFYVCHYCPAGNNVGRLYRPYTEGEHCARCPDHCDNELCTNSCEYEDDYSNCQELKTLATCEDPVVKTQCQASCNCEGKIY